MRRKAGKPRQLTQDEPFIPHDFYANSVFIHRVSFRLPDSGPERCLGERARREERTGSLDGLLDMSIDTRYVQYQTDGGLNILHVKDALCMVNRSW